MIEKIWSHMKFESSNSKLYISDHEALPPDIVLCRIYHTHNRPIRMYAVRT